MYGCLSNIPTYPIIFMVNLTELPTTIWVAPCFASPRGSCVQPCQTDSPEEQGPLSAFSNLLWRDLCELHRVYLLPMETIYGFSAGRSSRSASYCWLQSKLCLRAHTGGSSRKGGNTFPFSTLSSSLHKSPVNFRCFTKAEAMFCLCSLSASTWGKPKLFPLPRTQASWLSLQNLMRCPSAHAASPSDNKAFYVWVE